MTTAYIPNTEIAQGVYAYSSIGISDGLNTVSATGNNTIYRCQIESTAEAGNTVTIKIYVSAGTQRYEATQITSNTITPPSSGTIYCYRLWVKS